MTNNVELKLFFVIKQCNDLCNKKKVTMKIGNICTKNIA